MLLPLWLALAMLSGAASTAAAPKPKPRPKPISSYGPISVGHPSAGYLVNGARMPAGNGWVLTAPKHAYATTETIEQLSHCLTRVRAEHPGSPPVMLGSLSGKGGGKIPPHDSHRTGRDVDVYFFRQPGAKWHDAATRDDIDLVRTWALLRCFITDCDVDFVLIDRAVQNWLQAHAVSAGEPEPWVRRLFHDAKPGNWDDHAVVREAPGHVAHMHVRFVSPNARKLGVELYDRLLGEGIIKAPRAALRHRVVRGETLSGIARRYRTRVATLQQLNRLKSTRIQIGQWLVIAPQVALRGAKDAVRIPPRRQPPSS
jgi:LysM repeat protein